MGWTSQLSATSVITALAALVLTRIIWQVAVIVFSSPLNGRVPGPFIARLTDKWILLVDLSGYRARTVNALHKKYGPVVRLAPKELSFSSLESIKPIYGSGTTCVKAPIYDNIGRPGIFQMRDPEMHRQRLKRLAHVFSPSSLNQTEPLVHSVTNRLVEAIEARVGEPVDALHWARMAALDVSGEVLLGKPFGAFEGGGEAPAYVHHLDNAFLVWQLEALAPRLCWALAKLPIKSLRGFFAAGDYVYDYGNDALRDYLRLYGRTSTRRNLLTKIIAGNPESGTGPLSDKDIGVEISDLVFAATDTTGNTITYALYRLCCHPEWQQRLREEIRNSGVKERGFPFQALHLLPVLNGVFTETLRLHPAAPSSLPRITTIKNTQIDKVYLPQNAFTTQRDPEYFPEPEEFKPDRWIAKDGSIDPGTSDQRDMMLAWGKGSRICLGQHMATLEIKIVLSRLLERFEVQLGGPGTHAEMEMTDHFTLIPKGQKCTLKFTEI